MVVLALVGTVLLVKSSKSEGKAAGPRIPTVLSGNVGVEFWPRDSVHDMLYESGKTRLGQNVCRK